MAHTNSTENYGLPQWIGTDKPTFLGDFNTAFGAIDTQMKANSDAATTAVATANSADATATSANTNATTALNTANSAATDAATAVSTASTANSTANTANTNASAALRASAANTIENLAPAYDPTLTYEVGDLVTYIDAQNSGKLYKCIVAVNSPMEFNVNYWDDVTTSEVYAQPRKLVGTVTASGDTIGTFLNKLNLSSFDITKFYEGEYIVSNSKTMLHLLSVTPTELSVIRDIISGTTSQQVVFRISSNSSAFRWEFATSGNTQVPLTDTSVTDGTVINIYEL